MKFFRICLFLIASTLILSCAPNVKQIQDSNSLDINNGVLVTKIVTNHSDQITTFNPLKIVFYNYMGRTTNYNLYYNHDNKVIASSLPAGEYKWKLLKYGDEEILLESSLGFAIKPGEITYIGDIHIIINQVNYNRTASLHVINSTAFIEQELGKEYPLLMGNNKLASQITNIEPRYKNNTFFILP